MQILDVLVYFIGSLLLVFGPVRAYFFGWKPATFRDETSAPNGEAKSSGRRSPAQRRHMFMGMVFFLLGLVLIVTTLRTARARSLPQRDDTILIRSSRTYTP